MAFALPVPLGFKRYSSQGFYWYIYQQLTSVTTNVRIGRKGQIRNDLSCLASAAGFRRGVYLSRLSIDTALSPILLGQCI
jgi:hypothetical protein